MMISKNAIKNTIKNTIKLIYIKIIHNKDYLLL